MLGEWGRGEEGGGRGGTFPRCSYYLIWRTYLSRLYRYQTASFALGGNTQQILSDFFLTFRINFFETLIFRNKCLCLFCAFWYMLVNSQEFFCTVKRWGDIWGISSPVLMFLLNFMHVIQFYILIF